MVCMRSPRSSLSVPSYSGLVYPVESKVAQAKRDALIRLVPNSQVFASELLPQYFKHSKFSSFVRQLNMFVPYGIILREFASNVVIRMDTFLAWPTGTASTRSLTFSRPRPMAPSFLNFGSLPIPTSNETSLSSSPFYNDAKKLIRQLDRMTTMAGTMVCRKRQRHRPQHPPRQPLSVVQLATCLQIPLRARLG